MSKKNEFLFVELDKDLDPPSGGIGEFTLAPSGVYSLELQGEVICELGIIFLPKYRYKVQKDLYCKILFWKPQ